MKSQYHGAYSKKQEEIAGSSVYLNKDNKEVICTQVEKEDGCPNCLFDDKVLLGPVLKFLRTEKKARAKWTVL